MAVGTGGLCSNNSATAGVKVHDAFTCAADGYDTSTCLNKEDQCPASDWLVPIILGVYTLITQVMMLNLLIAMFRCDSLLLTTLCVRACVCVCVSLVGHLCGYN